MSKDISDRVYDAYIGDMGQQFMRQTQQRIHWTCAEAEGSTVLDVGCSQGLVAILLGREGKTVIGMDRNPTAIREAQERLAAEPVEVRSRVAFVEADFAKDNPDFAAVDCIVMGEVLEHLVQPGRFIEAAASRLRVGGRLIVTVPFGINDHVDHKHTFYLLEPYRLLSTHFDIVKIALPGKWLGLVGVRREVSTVAGASWSDEDLRLLEGAFELAERQLVDQAAALRGKLDEANTKYRSSTEEVSRLKRELSHAESERKHAERQCNELQASLASRTDTAVTPAMTALSERLDCEREQRHEREVTLARLEERLKSVEQVRAFELQACEAELARLTALNASLESELDNIRQQASAKGDAAERLATELKEARQRQDELSEQHAASREHILSLELQLAEQATRHATELASLQRELATREQQAFEAMVRSEALGERLERSLLQVSESAQRAEAEKQGALAHVVKSEQQLRSLERERDELLKRVREAEDRAQESDERRAEAERNERRSALQAETERRERAVAERRTSLQLEAERSRSASAERRAIQTRNSLSFQLGYELIHGFKSRDAIKALPAKLWHLQQEASRRRHEKAHRHHVPVGSARPIPSEAASPTSEVIRALRKEPTPAAAPQSTQPGAALELKRLRVACIHDEFTFTSFAPECQLLPLTPSGWRTELEAFRPELLFVESAWRGKDDLWTRKVAQRAQDLVDIVQWCRRHSVPTVFWNKEDPVHYRTFLNTAKLFDVVFTTDIDSIPRYKRALGNDRVYLLPFAVQPKIHNPLEKYSRKDAIAFAGAYYARYPERQADLASFADSFADAPRLEIFDRNLGKKDPDYQFPERYKKHIVGTLRFDEVDRAYKGYHYALNLNSIKASQTMFARRVFELLASNTTTVSNFSRGVRLMFGDLVVTTDRGERALERIGQLTRDDSVHRRLRLAALRKVLSEHTYEDRLRVVASKVWSSQGPTHLPTIAVLARVTTPREAEQVLAGFNRQRYPHKRLYVVSPEGMIPSSDTALEHLTMQAAARTRLAVVAPSCEYVAPMLSADFYGENYLWDLALATRYTSSGVIGKGSRYRLKEDGQLKLENDGAQYRTTSSLPARAAMARRDALPDTTVDGWLAELGSRRFEWEDCVAVDEFNYCEAGASLREDLARDIEDLKDIDHGLSLERFFTAADAAAPLPQEEAPPRIEAQRLGALFKPGPTKPIAVASEGDRLVVRSSLPDETHEYLYATEAWSLQDLGLPEPGHLRFEATPGLNLQLAVIFLDAGKKRLGHKLCQPGANETLTTPPGAAHVQLALRIYGPGQSSISGLSLGHASERPHLLLGRGRYLLITNRYPTDGDLYRNAFVHRRVLEYMRQGIKVDVFRTTSTAGIGFYEFEGVDVITGPCQALEALLSSNHYESVLVHFLDPATWQVLLPWLDRTRMLIWAHGSEIQAWHRRDSHYGSGPRLEAAKAESEARKAFWRGVVKDLRPGSKLIFVSRHFAEEVQTDLESRIPEDRCEVIHNVIDTQLFDYHPKTARHRTQILSIRPHTSRIYANDLVVAAILNLVDRPHFRQLQFLLIGDGPLFEDTTAPLRGLENVRLERRFLTQREIAELHRQHGVFLCATRGDTQGVSRDEAMASGLVPITNRVGAIPEFVDESCGIIAAPNDAAGLAAGVSRLYEDPALFMRLSEQAARRVRRQSSPEHTTQRELALIRGN